MEIHEKAYVCCRLYQEESTLPSLAAGKRSRWSFPVYSPSFPQRRLLDIWKIKACIFFVQRLAVQAKTAFCYYSSGCRFVGWLGSVQPTVMWFFSLVFSFFPCAKSPASPRVLSVFPIALHNSCSLHLSFLFSLCGRLNKESWYNSFL